MRSYDDQPVPIYDRGPEPRDSLVREKSPFYGSSPPRHRSVPRPASPHPALPGRPGGSFGASQDAIGRLLALVPALRRVQARLEREQARLLLLLRPNGRFQRVSGSTLGSSAEFWLQMAPRTARERARIGEILDQRPEFEAAFLEGKISPCQILAVSPLLPKGPPNVPAGVAAGVQPEVEGNDVFRWFMDQEDRSVRALRKRVRTRVQEEQRRRRAAAAGCAGVGADADTAGADTAESSDAGTSAPDSAGEPAPAAPFLEADPDADPEADPPFRTVRLSVPEMMTVEWEETIELARRQLGWDAPLYECVQALLAETAPDAVVRREMRREAEKIAREHGVSLREVIGYARSLGSRRIEEVCEEAGRRVACTDDAMMERNPEGSDDATVERYSEGWGSAMVERGPEDSAIVEGDTEGRDATIVDSAEGPKSVPSDNIVDLPRPRSRAHSGAPLPGSEARAMATAQEIAGFLTAVDLVLGPSAAAAASSDTVPSAAPAVSSKTMPSNAPSGGLADLEPIEILFRLRQLQLLENPARAHLARLLRSLRDTRGLYRSGYAGMEEFCRLELSLSDRAARNLVREAECLEASPALEEAFGQGLITTAQAARIVRLTGVNPLFLGTIHEDQEARIGRWIERARQVTVRQFERECRFFLRLQEYSLPLFSSCHGPLPNPEIEPKLLRELQGRGWSRRRIRKALRAGGVGVTKEFPLPEPWPEDGSCPPLSINGDPGSVVESELGSDLDSDPAANHVLMRRLEALLNLLIIASSDEAVRKESTLAMALAVAEEERGRGRNLSAAFSRETGGLRSETEGAHWSPEPFRRWREIRFAAPEPLIEQWKAALDMIAWESS